jgi:hypothetical protein
MYIYSEREGRRGCERERGGESVRMRVRVRVRVRVRGRE